MNDNSTAGPHPYTRTLLEEIDRQRRLRDRWQHRARLYRLGRDRWRRRAQAAEWALRQRRS